MMKKSKKVVKEKEEGKEKEEDKEKRDGGVQKTRRQNHQKVLKQTKEKEIIIFLCSFSR